MRIALGALIVAVFAVLVLPLRGWGQINPGGCGASSSSACYTQGGGGGSVPTLAYSSSTSASVATTSGTLISAGAYTRSLQICTLPASTTNVWLNATGAAAVVGAGIPVYSAGGCTNFGSEALPIPTTAITAITDSASAQTVTITGG
jgi:hypothetical protein